MTSSFIKQIQENNLDEIKKELMNNTNGIVQNLNKCEFDSFGNEVTALSLASELGHADLVSALIHHGANVNQTNDFHWTPLMHASVQNHSHIVQVLLENHADVDATDGNGWTALMFAAKEGHVNVVKLLLLHNANTKLTNRDGKTAADLGNGNAATNLLS